MAYGFAKTELEPYAAEWDKTKHFPIKSRIFKSNL